MDWQKEQGDNCLKNNLLNSDKKIALLAFQYSKVLSSFGACLQLYATSKFLKLNGYNCDIINFIPFEFDGVYCGEGPNAFDVFRKDFMPNLTKEYKKISDLKELNEKYNIFITGSDQVWRNWGSVDNLYVYMLDFVNDMNKKIALSASFGKDEWSEDETTTNKAKQLISRFDSISLREDSGVLILKNIFKNENCKQLLDPSLMLTDKDYSDIYNKSTLKNINKDYLLKLSIRSDKKMNEIIKALNKHKHYPVYDGLKQDLKEKFLIEKIKRKNKFERIFKGKYKKVYQSKYIINSVCDWLNYIKNAKFIITDSYHGVMFSIIFKKNFVCITNEYGGISRMESFLKLINQKHRLIFDNKDINYEKCFEDIDYGCVYEILNPLIQKTKEFLIENIEKCEV